MTNGPVGVLVVVGFLVAAVGSVPLVITAVILSRRLTPFSRALRTAASVVGVVVVVLAVAVATITPEAGVAVVAVAAVSGVLLWVVPLVVARWVLVRRGVDPERALLNATAGLPVALLASLLLAFGDFDRYNITFLTGPEAVVAWTALVLVVVFGPAVIGVAVEYVRQ